VAEIRFPFIGNGQNVVNRNLIVIMAPKRFDYSANNCYDRKL